MPSAASTARQKLDPGEHSITVVAAGFQDATEVVTLVEKHHEQLKLALTEGASSAPLTPVEHVDSPSTSDDDVPLLAYVGFGAGAVGLVVGTVAGVMTLSQVSAIEDKHCVGTKCGAGAQDDYDSADTTATVANIGFALAGVGAAVGVLSLVLGSDSSASIEAKFPAPRVRASVAATPGGAGLWLHGEF